ncbi:hypothetical protein SEA_ITER_36 [Arthrobacter phage Iter]|nr:hypothetical protein SEA_ITER_36 [Arthrobacter phage Iter]
MSAADVIAEAVKEAIERRARHEEAACWAMLADPLERGVLVTERGLSYTIELSQEVPWLEIHVRKEAEE